MPYALPREVLKNPADSRELPSRLPRPENAKFMPSNQIDFTTRKGSRSENDFLETGDAFFLTSLSFLFFEPKRVGPRQKLWVTNEIIVRVKKNTNYRLLCI